MKYDHISTINVFALVTCGNTYVR